MRVFPHDVSTLIDNLGRHRVGRSAPRGKRHPFGERDISFIVEMIADDELGKTRENFQPPLPDEYLSAFRNIITDKIQGFIVVEDEHTEIVGTLQLSFI